MAKNVNTVNCINWEHSENFLRRSDGLKLSHPSSLLRWVDDIKKWPELSYGDIFNYFVLSEGVDGAAMKNFKIFLMCQMSFRQAACCFPQDTCSFVNKQE